MECPGLHEFSPHQYNCTHFQSQINFNEFPLNFIYSQFLEGDIQLKFNEKCSFNQYDKNSLIQIESNLKNNPTFKTKIEFLNYFLLKNHKKYFDIPSFDTHLMCFVKQHGIKWYEEKIDQLNSNYFRERLHEKISIWKSWYEVCKELFEIGYIIFEIVLHKKQTYLNILSAFTFYYRIVMEFSITILRERNTIRHPPNSVSGNNEFMNLIYYGYAIFCLLTKIHLKKRIEGERGWNTLMNNNISLMDNLYNMAGIMAIQKPIPLTLPESIKKSLLMIQLKYIMSEKLDLKTELSYFFKNLKELFYRVHCLELEEGIPEEVIENVKFLNEARLHYIIIDFDNKMRQRHQFGMEIQSIKNSIHEIIRKYYDLNIDKQVAVETLKKELKKIGINL